jgi:hypothetical protein
LFGSSSESTAISSKSGIWASVRKEENYITGTVIWSLGMRKKVFTLGINNVTRHHKYTLIFSSQESRQVYKEEN